jgi:hypothetical protein
MLRAFRWRTRAPGAGVTAPSTEQPTSPVLCGGPGYGRAARRLAHPTAAALGLLLALSTPAAESSLLSGLRPGHPRLFLDTGSVARVQALAARDPLAGKIYSNQLRRAEGMLKDPVSVHAKRDGKRLLDVSRRVLDRVQTLAFARLALNDPRYAERAWRELDAVASFPDWNPAHFLDTAEMTRAVATGYDWLYADWTPAQRARLEQALLTLGLQPGLAAIEKKASWVTCDHNWNQVCHGGLGLAALAVADVFPAEATRLLESARDRLPRALAAYEPDGGGLEGPTYWSYGCGYHVFLLAGLQSALGHNLGLGDAPALGRSGFYQIYLSNPRGVAFDFADSRPRALSDPVHGWLGQAYDEPVFNWYRRRMLEQNPSEGDVFDLLWWNARGDHFDPATLPLDRHFRHAECASLRSSWTDPDALVLAIQGGDTAFNHSHLDRGSFILEAQGIRWIMDSGVEHQTYQAHVHKLSRWLFYRVRAEGHNTLVLNPGSATNGPDQLKSGRAPITRFATRADAAQVELDMTSAYSNHAQSVRRTFDLVDRRSAVVVTDRVRAEPAADLWWFAHTEAEVAVAADGRSATLRHKGKQLVVALEAPAGAQLGVMDARPLPTSPNPSIQESNKGRRKLFIHVPAAGTLDLRVRFTPAAPAR